MFHLILRSIFPLTLLVFIVTTIKCHANYSVPSSSKRIFCHLYSDCRIRARRELESCVGGPVSALMAKSEGPFKKSVETEEKRTCNGMKCAKSAKRISSVIGRSIHAMYSRLERKALKCPEDLINEGAILNSEKATKCQAVHLELFNDGFPVPSPFSFFLTANEAGTGKKDECALAYEAEIDRCRMAVGMCCPGLDSKIGTKEQRILRMVDKCMNETPLKSADILFTTTNLTVKSDRDGHQISIEASQDDPSLAVPIVSDATPSPPPPKLPNYNFDLDALNSDSVIPSTSASTMFPPPDPTLRRVIDLIFPGLAINGRRNMKKKTQRPKPPAPNTTQQIGAFVLDESRF